MKNSSEIRELLMSDDHNPGQMELSQIYELLYSNKHFLNLLGDILIKKPATAKVEKFLA